MKRMYGGLLTAALLLVPTALPGADAPAHPAANFRKADQPVEPVSDNTIIAEDSTESLKQRVSGDVVTIEVGGDLAAGRAALERLDRVREVIAFGADTLRMSVDNSDHVVVAAINALGAAGLDVRSLKLTRPTLEDVFLRRTGYGLFTQEDAEPEPEEKVSRRKRKKR